MSGQGDSPISNGWLSRTRYRRKQTGAFVKGTASDQGSVVWTDYQFPAGGTSYSITITSSSISLSGQSIGLNKASVIEVTAGSLALSGQIIGLNKTSAIEVTAGSLSLSGQSINLNKTSVFAIVVLPGTIALTGQAINLVFSGQSSSSSGARRLAQAKKQAALEELFLFPVDAKAGINEFDDDEDALAALMLID